YYRLGVVPYAPLARGVLTGKYVPGRKPPKNSRAASGDARFMASENRLESLRIAQRLKSDLEKQGIKLAHFAMAWVLNNALVTSVIAGPRTLEQWQEYLAALSMPFDPAGEALVEQYVARGHASTHGYTDPKFPVTGRVVALR